MPCGTYVGYSWEHGDTILRSPLVVIALLFAQIL